MIWRWAVGDVFTLAEWETEGSCGQTTFRWHRYIPVPMEQLFAHQKPYPGRTRRLSHEQHTVNPVSGDLCDPIGRLREQYGFGGEL